MNRRRAYALVACLLVAAIASAILLIHQVDNALTREDREYIQKILLENHILRTSNLGGYADQLRNIREVQAAVLKVAGRNTGIPYGCRREPKDLYLGGSGLCYDRSRVIEKILRYLGFRVRHVSVYSTATTKSVFWSIVTPGVDSHAVSEVKTLKGWLVVDSNAAWISLDTKGEPISMRDLQRAATNGEAPWDSRPNRIFAAPFTYVIGLYSRHGKFYPPYDFIPDVNYRELAQNFE